MMKSQIASGRSSQSTAHSNNLHSSFTEQSAQQRSAMRQIYPRRRFVTSMSQALIAMSLALSIMTFVISLVEILPMRQGDLPKQESLQYNAFICLIVPLVLAYCSQSKVIAMLTQQWILLRTIDVKEYLSMQNVRNTLSDAFKQTAALAGLPCVADLIGIDHAAFEGQFLRDCSARGPNPSRASEESGQGCSKSVAANVLIGADGASSRTKHSITSLASLPDQLFSSIMVKDQMIPNFNSKPKCLVSSPNFDAYSTETDTPQNERCGGKEGKTFEFPANDSSSDRDSALSSNRNSMQNEDRPAPSSSMELSISQLILCHFGQELHNQHMSFNGAFGDLQKLKSQASRSIESFLPFKELFLQDFTSLEKILVIINAILFAVSLNDDNLDQEVGTAILYIMLSIAYFVTTTTCLSGANSLKRRACQKEVDLNTAPDSEARNGEGISPITISTENSASTNRSHFTQKHSGKKQNASKRQNEARKSAHANISEKKPVQATVLPATTLKSKQKQNLCHKMASLLTALAMFCENYAKRFLRLAFFLLNLTMLWLCIVNID